MRKTSQFVLKSFFRKAVIKVKDCFVNEKSENLEVLEAKILEDTSSFDTIVVLCLGKYEETFSPYLTFASKVGTILKANQIPVYGEESNPILIDNKLPKVSREIVETYPNPFVLVVMNSVSDAKKVVGNIYYESKSYETDKILVGDATLNLCGSYSESKNKEEYDANSISMDLVNEIATDMALFLMKVVNKKQELANLDKEEITHTLKKETE